MNIIVNNEEEWKEAVLNENELKDYIVSTIIMLGSIGFFTVGLSSYLNINLLPIFNANNIVFFPQGITMCFYGFLGLILSILQLITLYFKVGTGINKINKKEGTLEIERNGFPGNTHTIKITYKIKDILFY